MDNVASKMSRLAKNELYYKRQVLTDEVLRKLDAITRDDVQRMVEAYCRPDGCFLVGLGPVARLSRWWGSASPCLLIARRTRMTALPRPRPGVSSISTKFSSRSRSS
jgi:hypothetical protein